MIFLASLSYRLVFNNNNFVLLKYFSSVIAIF